MDLKEGFDYKAIATSFELELNQQMGNEILICTPLVNDSQHFRC